MPELVTLLLAAGAFFLAGAASGAVVMGAALTAAPLLAVVDPALVPYTLRFAHVGALLRGRVSPRMFTWLIAPLCVGAAAKALRG